MNKRGQLTIFIIIAIVIVVALGLFLFFGGELVGLKIPPSIEPAYNTFLSCLEEDALEGIDMLESRGGYIYLPDFEPGSRYMPFSSQLFFLGNPIPYWYYVSGNAIQQEQVPSKKDMEDQLAEFINSKIRNCVFEKYYEEGFNIDQGEPDAKVSIKGDTVEISLNMDLNIDKGEDNVRIEKHRIVVNSNLGNLYISAKKVYEKEQKELFLEDYALDTLRIYAPVDGVELSCAPKVWEANEVFDNLREAIEANTLALKSGSQDDYFSIDLPVSNDVRFLNSKSWPSSFEVLPSEGSLLIAEPLGNQQGLGVLGFCYVPYHFVYNLRYPVLIQVYEGNEIFQFPVAVVIQGNNPREALEASAIGAESPELCRYMNTPVTVRTYDTNLNPVEAEISYECFGEVCDIGKTSSGKLQADFPQCVNGYIIASSENFKEAKLLFSTVETGNAEMILDRLYEMDVGLKLDGKDYNQNALISFISGGSSETIDYPNQKSVKLGEGQYEIQVYIYKNSSLKIGDSVKEQCIEVSSRGLRGLFGMAEEKCFEINIPSQFVSSVLAGGGTGDYYLLESELKGKSIIEINAESLPVPKSIEDLQDNYLLFETKGLDIIFK